MTKSKYLAVLCLLTAVVWAQTESGGTSAAGGRGSLTLTILGPALSITPSSFDFGQVAANTSSQQVFTLSNPGNATLTALSFSSPAAPYSSITTCGTSIAAGGSCTLTVTYLPTAGGTFNSSIQVAYSGGVSFIGLTGSSTTPSGSPVASVSPTSLVFGQQAVGTTSPAKSVTYSNTGNAELLISGVTTSGPFSADASACTSVSTGTANQLDPGTSCSVKVTYSPSAAQADTGTVVFTDNSAQSPLSVSLSGTGVASTSSGASLGSSPTGQYLELETTSALQGSSTAIAEVQNVNTFCGSSGTSCSGTVNNVTAGNALIVTVRWTPQTVTLTVPGFTCAATQPKPGIHVMAMCYAFNVSGGNTTVTANFSAAASTSSVSVTEFSGVSGIDQAVVGGSLGSVSSLASPSVTTSQPSDLLYGFCYTGTATAIADTNFVGLWGGNIMPEYRIVNAIASYNVTCKASASANLGVLLGTFKGSGNAVTATSPYSSIAELTAINNSGTTLSTAGWTATCDSEDTTQPCTNAIDGNAGSFWQSQTVGSTPPQPHHAIVNLGSAQTLSAITALVRQDGCSNGWPIGYNVYLDNLSPPVVKVASGTLAYTGFSLGCPGAGTPPAFNLSLAGGSGNFGSVNVGTTSAPQTFYLASTGSTALTITSVAANGDYAQTNNCPISPSTLVVGDSCAITITFTPTTTGTRTGTILVNDDAPNSPQSISLTGTGQSTAKTLQSVSVAGPSSIVISTTGQFVATCHYSDGSSSSCTASWALSNNTATGTTVNASTGLVTAGSTTGSATITATNTSISGSTTFSVINSTALLTNVCANPTVGPVDCTTGNQITLPSNWNLLCTLSFESGSRSATTVGQCDTGTKVGTGGVSGGGNALEGTVVHHGSQAWTTGTYGNNNFAQAGAGFTFVSLPAGFHEVYMSWWQQFDAFTNGVGFWNNGADLYTANFKPPSGVQQMTVNYCCGTGSGTADPGGFGFSNGPLIWQPQGTNLTQYQHAIKGSQFVGFDGIWHHYEVHYLANTCNPCGTTGSGTPNSDGILQVWVDGAQLLNPNFSFNNVVLNGPYDMSGMSAQIGGHAEGPLDLNNLSSATQTACNTLWAAGGPYSCGTLANRQYACDTSHFNPASGGAIPSFANINAACAGQAPPHTYKKYIDDVVILYK